MVGRIAAIHNRLHNETHHDKVGFFGFFECINDFTVASRLFDAAADWLRPRGLEVIRGPMSFSTNDECGVLIEGFDTPNSIMMPHNPPYHLTLMETAGFVTAQDLVCLQGGSLDAPVTPPERTARAVDLILRRYGLRIRALDLKRFRQEVDLVKQLYNASWEMNWGFVPMTDAEIDHLAASFKPVVIPDLVPIVEREDGTAIAFGLALPDLNEALRNNRNGSTIAGTLRILWYLWTRRFTRARVLLLGVLPEWRGKGIDSALYHWIWSRAAERNIGWGEAGWLLADNAGIIQGLSKAGFTPYKTYRVLDRPL
ncbi:MAG TPA: GNAT family N-acetyltransferase [Gemmatimonadales bacterium]|nr:GNAT family N-acetyltransferase [Gemmatimonadales bacterium]